MSVAFAKWVDNFCQWPDIGQGFFIFVVLSMLIGFITVLVRGYPPYGQK